MKVVHQTTVFTRVPLKWDVHLQVHVCTKGQIMYAYIRRMKCLFEWPLCISLWLCVPSLIFTSCSDRKIIEPLTIQGETVLDSVPSGSGLAIYKNSIYIIGDDATGVYILDQQNFSPLKIPIAGFKPDEYRQPRDTKHDFESATLVDWQGQEYLLAFGSGSKKNLRDSLLLFNVNNHSDQRIISLTPFYNELQRITSTEASQWNMEGATVVADSLILCNRGNNIVIKIGLEKFLQHILEDKAAFPEIVYHRILLPMIDKREARFSGICTLSDSLLLFCASVEDTPDWTQDGPVMGSYVGIYSISKNELVASYLLKNTDGEVLKEKIESIDILDKQNDMIHLLAIADNDNGSSKLFRLTLQLDTTR